VPTSHCADGTRGLATSQISLQWLSLVAQFFFIQLLICFLLETPTTEDYVEKGHDAKVTCKVTNSNHDGNIVFEMNKRMISAVPVSDGGQCLFISQYLLFTIFLIIFMRKTWLPY
jgi:hypothetical protein